MCVHLHAHMLGWGTLHCITVIVPIYADTTNTLIIIINIKQLHNIKYIVKTLIKEMKILPHSSI